MVAKRFHSSIIWQRARARQLRAVPYCERCLAEHTLTVAVIAHHKIDVDERPDLRLDPANLESLCRQHHEIEHHRAPAYSRDFGLDGLPTDKNHPIYRPRPVVVKPTPRRR
jgi:hypothetical protein